MINKFGKKLFVAIISLILVSCSRQAYESKSTSTTSSDVPSPSVEITLQTSTVDESAFQNSTLATQVPTYTFENPATSYEEVVDLLRLIQLNFLNQIKEPGWYSNGFDYGDNQAWVYVSDPTTKHISQIFTTISYLNYSNPLGDVAARSIMIEDGKQAYFGLNDTRSDTKIGDEKITNPNEPLSLDPKETLSIIRDYGDFDAFTNTFLNWYIELMIEYLEPGFNPGIESATYSAWFTGSDNEELIIEQVASGNLWRKDDHSSQIIKKATTQYRFNWKEASLLSVKSDLRYSDETSGETSWSSFDLDRYVLNRFDDLPPKTQVLYDDAKAKLLAEYAK